MPVGPRFQVQLYNQVFKLNGQLGMLNIYIYEYLFDNNYYTDLNYVNLICLLI